MMAAVKVTKWTRTDRIIPTTCYYWLNGRCNRNPCRFLHTKPPLPSTASHSVGNTFNCNGRKRCYSYEPENSLPKRKLNAAAVLNTKSRDSTVKAEVVKAAQSSPTLSTKVVKAAKSSSSTLSTKVVEASQNSSPTLTTKVVEAAQSSSPILTTEVVEAAQSSSPILTTEVVEPAQSSSPILSTEVVEAVSSSPVKVAQSSSPVEVAQSSHTLSTEVVEATKSSSYTLSTKVVEADSSPTLSTKVVETAQSSSPILTTEVVEPAQSSSPTLSTEVVEAVSSSPVKVAQSSSPVEVAQSSSPTPTICKYWINGNCVHGDNCRDIHSWFSGDRLSAVTNLEGHKELVSGITLPVGTNKLCSGSTDGTVRIWDCDSGQCANVINLGAEVNSLISEGPWIFVGLSNIVKAWNIQTGSEYSLDGPNGRVLAMTVGCDTLLAGAEDGVISAWRGSSEANSPFKLVASLRGHAKSVVSLTVGCLNKRLFSGSMDHSIKVWDLDTFDCKMTLNGHTDTVTSLICWGNFLLSSSLDCTIKVWAESGEKTFQVAYTHNVENGIVALNAMTDAEDKSILFCSCLDNSVRLYELPSFSERGRLFARQEVRSIEKGPEGLIFTGDGTGLVTVSKWSEEPKVEAA